jgi:predicted esterase
VPVVRETAGTAGREACRYSCTDAESTLSNNHEAIITVVMRISTTSTRTPGQLQCLSFTLGFLFAVNLLPALEIGATREAVIAEKGPPHGKMEAGSVEFLKYPDQALKLRDGKVIAIEPVVARAESLPEAEAESLGVEALSLQKSRPIAFRSGTLVELSSALVYVPRGIEAGKKYPLVFALSPSGDALSMIGTWASVADKRRWIVAASTEFKNGVRFSTLLARMDLALSEVEQSHPIDPTRVVFAGFSGGGMGAHAFAKFHPARVRAVVVNTGMMQPSFATDDYPQGKLAVFIASPSDFRYSEMKADRAFLEQRRWKTAWIEFDGGHTVAPPEIYERAAAVLADAMK